MKENAYADLEILLVFAIFIGMLVYAATLLALPVVTQEPYEKITVIEKIPYHDGKYLITADICTRDDLYSQKTGSPVTCVKTKREVFSVSDELSLLVFDASDRYANLKENTNYSVDVCGIRYQPLSMYRNIYRIHEEIP